MSKQTSTRVLFAYTLSLLRRRVFLAVLTLVVLTPVLTTIYSITRGSLPVAEAAAPTTLNFQARLLNSSGNLVSDGNYSVEFKLYNVATDANTPKDQGACTYNAGTPDPNCLWTETRTGGNQVVIKNGYLSAYLGDVSALPTNIWDQQLWLTMNVHNGVSFDGEMTPRIRLTSVPYAFRATVAESAQTLYKHTGSFAGTVDFENMTADRRFLFPDTSLATTADPGTICVYNGSVSNCPAATGSEYYIHNDLGLQTEGNFNIQARDSGANGTVAGIFRGAAAGQTVDLAQFQATNGTVLGAVTSAGNLQVAGSLDTRTAGTLSLGTATATAITIGKAGITTTNAGALTVTELGTFNGGLMVASNLTVTQAGNVAFQRNTTDFTATGTQDDVNLGTGALFRLNGASAQTITSIQGGVDGRIITLVNAGANTATIQNDSGGTAANRIVTGTGGNLSLPTGASIQLTYDSSASRWRVVGGIATSGGGANQQLSNLSGTIAINASLTPDADNTLDLGSSSFSWRTLYADTSVLTPRVDTATGTTLLIGDTTATAITLGRNGITTTNAGALTVTELLTANAGITASGGALSLTGNAASSLTTSSGALTLTSAAAAVWSTAAGNLTVDSAAALQLGTTNATSVSISKTGVTTTVNGALTVTQLGTFNGGLTVASDLTVTQAGNVAFQRNTTDFTAIGTQDDVSLGTGVLFRINGASAQTITSIQGGVDGRVITIVNAGANAAIIQNNSGGTAANRIITGTGGSLSVPSGATIQLAYDSSASRWRVIGGSAISGGGANQQLSNLSGTVAVNTHLNPDADNTLDLGSGSYSWRTLYADTSVLSPRLDTATATTLLIGDTTANAITIGKAGVTTTNAGALTVTELLTANAGATVSGGAVSLTGNAASSLTTSSGALTLTSAAAAVWSTAAGNLTVDSAAALQLGTTNATSVSISKTGVTTTVNGALTVTQLGTFNGGLTVASDLTVTNAGNVAFQRNTTDFTATGTQDDVSLGTGVLFRLNGASAQTITSIQGGADGRIITLINAGANAATIQNNSGGTAANRIITGTGGNLNVPAGSSIELAYDSSASRWRVIGGSATSGGGANQQLSNLSGTIAINASLTPDDDNTLDLGSSSFSWRTIYADTSVLAPRLDTATAATLNIGNTNANAITIGKAGVTTTNAGALTVTELLTANAGATVSGGAISLTGNAASSFTTSSGALTLTSAAAAVWSTAAGNLTVDSAAALQLGTTNATSVSISKTGVTTTVNGALTVTQAGTFNGGLTVASDFTVTNAGNVAFQRNTTDFTATGTQDDVNLGAGVLFRLNGASAQTITSIAGGTDGRVITLVNAGANAATIQNDSGGTAANRIITGTGGNLSVPSGATIQLAYDSSANRWRIIGGSAVAGGGANQQLSNLSGTIAINASLTPDGDNTTRDLGSSAFSWRTLYADTSVLTPTVDTATATTLNIGTTTANAVSISRTGVTTTVNGALTVTEAGQFNGGLTAASNLTVTQAGNVAFQRNTTDYSATGTQNDVSLGTGALFRITSASALTITSIANPADGRVITLMNASANTVTIQNDSGGTAANRIITGSGVDSLVPAGGSVTLAYDSSSTRWRIIGSSTGSIQLQAATPGTAQTGNFNVSGTGIAGTAFQSPLFDTATAVALGIGTTNATNVTIGHNAGTFAVDGTNFDLSTAGVLTLAGGQARDITTVNASTATGLTVKPGDSTGSNIAGPVLSLQGGAATAGNANGGAVTISGGAGFGTGTQGLVNLSTTAFTSSAVQTPFGAGVTAIDSALVNNYSTIPITATSTSAIVSVPDPAQLTATGRVLYITATDASTDFTLRLNAGSVTPIDIAMKKNSTATLIWNGDEWTAAGASSSTDLQSAYNNTLTSAGGAEIVLNPVGGNADGFTIRNNGTTPIVGGLLEVQSSTGSNLLSVNNNATEYAVNGGAETTTNFSTNWTNIPATSAVVTQSNDAGYFATGQYSTKVVNTAAANDGAKNVLSTALTSGMTYSVSFTAKAPTNFATLQILYSPDGTTAGTTQCATTQTVTSANWTRILCNFVASGSINSSNAILIRQTDATGRTFYIDNLSVQVNANMTFAADGSVSSALGSNWTQYDTGTGSTTLLRSTATLYDTDGAVQDTTSANSGQGMRNNMPITPATSTQYRVSFYAKTEAGKAMSSSIAVGFLPAGGNSLPVTAQECVDYNTRSVSDTNWTLVTCIITTPSSGISDPDLVIYQTDSTDRIFFVDALTITLNTNNSNNVQVGGANEGGPTTLLTLDRAAGAPIAANNDAYLGSMYYDTTTGRIQCYEADGWGACGSSPDNIITLTPEYAGAVLGGPGNGGLAGIGVMTSEFCANETTGITFTVGTLCDEDEARNFYRWTSPQATEQVYSIYVTYKLPATFKNFNDSNTIKLTALSDDNDDAIATLQVYRKKVDGSGITACGASAQTINDSEDAWQQTPYDSADETTCGFVGGDNIIFKIDMKSKNNGNIYVENLDFIYNNN